MTPAAQWHSDVQVRLLELFRGRGLTAGIEVGLLLGPKSTRVLDVATFKGERDRSQAYFAPNQIAIAVEVVSPGTVDNDFREKPILYAKLGIPEFWRITEEDEEDSYAVEVFVLDPGQSRYRLHRTATLDEVENE